MKPGEELHAALEPGLATPGLEEKIKLTAKVE